MACKLEVGTVWGSDSAYPVSRKGWGDAYRRARAATMATRRLHTVDLQCGRDRIPLYQCDRDDKHAVCTIEAFSSGDKVIAGTFAIAGARRRKRRR